MQSVIMKKTKTKLKKKQTKDIKLSVVYNMQINKSNVYTAVNADELIENLVQEEKRIYGYFSNNYNSLKRAIEDEQTNNKCLYGELTRIMSDIEPRRFVLDKGDYFFALFYPTDDFLNCNRY